MQTDTGVLFRGFSTKALQAVAGILSGKAPTRSEGVASALTRVERLLNAEAEAETTIKNLPGLLRSRGFADEAAGLEDALGVHEYDATLDGGAQEPADEPEAPEASAEPEPQAEDPIAIAEETLRIAKAELGRLLAAVAKAKAAVRDAEAAVRAAGGKRAARRSAGATSPRKPGSGQKVQQMIAMLQRPEGVTVDQLVDEFDWKPHTARARLSEPKKIYGARFHSTKEGRDTVYRILPEA